MFDAILGLASSSGLGAIVGSVFSWLGKKEARAEKAMELEYELKNRLQDLEELKLSQTHEVDMADKQMQIAETEGQIATDLKETDGWIESIKSGMKATGIAWVDAVRALMRPVITVYLLGISTYVAISISVLVGGIGSLPEDELLEMYRQVIMSLIMLTTTAVTWWFGSRPQQVSKK